MKRVLAMVLALVMLLGLCACGKEPVQEVTGKVKISIGMGTSAKIIDLEENALTKWLEEECNVDIEIVEYAGGTDVATQIAATIAAQQDLPDILWGVNIGASTINKYGQEEYFVNLRPYYEDMEGKSKIFWDRMYECLDEYQQDYVIRKMTDPDTGGMYGVPSIETSLVDDLDYMVWINRQWLDKLNLQAPTNTEELYTVLKAFKDNDCNGDGDPTDEIPLYGSQNTSSPAQVLDWLINMYIYFNDGHLWQDYDGDGKIESVYTQDKYREALKFINKLYEEKLLVSSVYTISSSDMKLATTPNNGKAICGIFAGHLTSHTTFNSEVLYQYECLQSWGAATKGDISFSLDCFITETAANRGIVDKCFELMMKMFTKDGALRIRYGEYGVNWTDADEGALSEYGIPAQYKMLNDPFMQQNSAMWGDIACTLNDYAEGESAQIGDELSKWQATKSRMLATAYEYYLNAVKNNNPKFLKDPFLETFVLNTKEDEEIDMKRTNVNNVINTYVMKFVTGAKGYDIDKDADWQKFLNEMNKEGYEDVRAMYQKCYERQKAAG